MAAFAAGIRHRTQGRALKVTLRVAVRFGVVLVLISVISAWTYRLHRARYGTDDANIFFVYATNLAQGNGFVYNAGGEHVEGFTSMLWVLILAPVFAFPRSPESHILILSVLLLAATHTLITLYIDRLFRKESSPKFWYLSFASVVYLLLIVASPSYITWMTVTLMDVCLWGFLLAGLTLLILTDGDRPPQKSDRLFAFLILLLTLARPEAIVLAPVFIGLRFVYHVAQSQSFGAAFRRLLLPFLACIVTLAALTTFRLSYFGYPLPNTFYAKVSPSLLYNIAVGIDYLQSYIRSSPVVSLSVLIVMLALTGRFLRLAAGLWHSPARKQRFSDALTPSTMSALIAVVLLSFPLLTGGDHFEWWRFYQPVYPLLLLSALALAHDWLQGLKPAASVWTWQGTSQKLAALVILAVFAFGFAQSDTNWWSLRFSQPLKQEFSFAALGFLTGDELEQQYADLPSWPSVAVIAAGGIKRSYPGTIIDLMGLNNTQMGHSPGDRKGVKNHAAFNKDVFFQLNPDVIWIRAPADSLAVYNDPRPPVYPVMPNAMVTLRGLPSDPRFLELYDYAKVRHQSSPYWINAFYRSDFLNQLTKDGRYEIMVAEDLTDGSEAVESE